MKQQARNMTTFFVLVLLAMVGTTTASAQTMMMPDRDVLSGVPVVVWGNTMEVAGPVTISFGDTSLDETPAFNINSQSYIATTHTYTTVFPSQTFTASLTVGGSMATVDITVIDPATLTPSQLEALQTNMAIEDGLRYQYVSVDSREARHDAGWSPMASWANHGAFTSMAVLAFENHSHTTTSGDIYSPVVQAGLNYVFNGLTSQLLNPGEPAGNPCAGAIANPCNGLRPTNAGAVGYSTSIALLAIAGSQTPGATVGAGLGVTSGQSYLEVAQRLANTVVWGQADSGSNRGGWRYGLDDNQSDGSAVGWNVLGLFDAAAFGASIPGFAADELEYEIAETTNASGGMGYTTVNNLPNTAKTGVRLSALSLIGVPLGGTTALTTITPQQSVDYINDGWNSVGNCSWGSAHPSGSPNLVNGKHCIYSTYNVFKGLKLYGVTTLPNVPRPDKDWHKDYQSFLVSIQSAPATTGGGSFSALQAFGFGTQGETALALLVLSSTALILPDPVKFSTIGLTPFTDTNFFGESHTVTAHAEGFCTPVPPAVSCTGPDVPGATVDFAVLSGPNTGAAGSGSAVTDASGNAVFTYTDTAGVAGTDTIQASIGSLNSNIVEKHWISPNSPPDVTNAVPSVACVKGPGQKLHSVDILGVTDPDGDPLTILITAITSDERTKKNGGDPAPDGFGVGTGTASVRDQRFGSGDGRVYEISFNADDGIDPPVPGSVFVAVPHDNAPPADPCSDAVDSGQIYDATGIN